MSYTFKPGHSYSAKLRLSGLQQMLAGESDVKEQIEASTGMTVEVEQIRSGYFLVTGVFHGEAPYTVELPEEVDYINDLWALR